LLEDVFISVYLYSLSVRYMDGFWLFSPVFRHFYDSSEKDVPILCHMGQKFSVLYKYPTFIAPIAVKYNQFQQLN